MRIVSLFPAATEIVCALGLADELVGISHACLRTEKLSALPRLTSWRGPLEGSAEEIDAAVSRMLRAGEPLYEFDASQFIRLQPDVVLSQSLCDVCAIDESSIRRTIRTVGARVWEWSPNTVDDILNGVGELGQLCNRGDAGEELALAIRCRLFNVRYLTSLIAEPVRVAFLEWLAPLYSAGHWIPELVEFAGGVDVLGTPGMRSSRISFEQLAESDSEVIIVGCCGWTAERTWQAVSTLLAAPRWQQLSAVRAGRMHVVDAETCFTAPSPSIADATEELARLIHFSSRQDGPSRQSTIASAGAERVS